MMDTSRTPVLSELTDPGLIMAATTLREAGAAQLADVRDAAEKWIAGVTALFGLFGIAGIGFTRSAVIGLSAWWQVGVGVAALVSIGLAAVAIYLSYRAAYGWPVTEVILDNDGLRNWYAARQAAPRVQARHLRNGVRAAAGSLTALVVTVGLLWYAPQPGPSGPLVRATLTDGAQVCGVILPAAGWGTPRIRRSVDGASMLIPVRSLKSLTAVSACLPGNTCQCGTNLTDGNRRVPGLLVGRVVVWVARVMNGDKFKSGVQAWGSR